MSQQQAPSLLNNRDLPAPIFLFEINMAHIAGQAMFVACTLNIAEQIGDGSKSIAELATASAANEDYLHRVLRTLSGLGVFEEQVTGNKSSPTFKNTPRSEFLKENHPMSMKSMILLQHGGEHIKTMTNLLYAVKNGTSAFEYATGTASAWDYYKNVEPERGLLFNKTMRAISQMVTAGIVAAYDFKPYKHIVDVGGSLGHLSASILPHADPSTVATVLDLPAVIEHAKVEQAKAIEQDANSVYKRITFQGGDFFESVPAGADLYVMKWIIHDHDDIKSKLILKSIRKVMPANSKLLIFDAVLNGENEYHVSKFTDLLMMAAVGGKERSEQQFKDLVSDCGLVVSKVYQQANIVECQPI